MIKIFDFLHHLKKHDLFYELDRNRANYIMVTVKIPGERWELEFVREGDVIVKRYGKIGEAEDEVILEYLFDNYSI